jgi:hypothetical protein
MLQIVVVIVGLLVVLTGREALKKGELQLSSKRRLDGRAAKTVGVATMIVGASIIAFAIFVFPMLLR